jgi:hypothetical protein
MKPIGPIYFPLFIFIFIWQGLESADGGWMTKTSPNFGCVTRRGNPGDLITRSFLFIFLLFVGEFFCVGLDARGQVM